MQLVEKMGPKSKDRCLYKRRRRPHEDGGSDLSDTSTSKEHRRFPGATRADNAKTDPPLEPSETVQPTNDSILDL